MKVEFGILGVPENWANLYKNRFVLYKLKREWLDTTAILGRNARMAANVPIATKGHPQRTILITQRRIRFLDKDGLYVSCKPIIDGLKTRLKRKVGRKFEEYEGAGLIYDDDPRHCDWEVVQVKTDGEPQIYIEIYIEESETTT